MSHNPYSSSVASAIAGNEFAVGPQPAAPLRLEVHISNPRSLDIKLSRAVKQLIPAALELRRGILVTQLGNGKYNVEVDAAVPCGTTHEKWS